MPVLSARDLKFFEDNGYVVAKGAIARGQALATAAEVRPLERLQFVRGCFAACRAPARILSSIRDTELGTSLIVERAAQVWSFTGMDPEDPETWYETRIRGGKEYGSKGAPGIMVEMCE